MANEIDLSQQLKAKRICRFCLTQSEPLSDIFSTENRMNSRAPLPLQIMSCVAIEVFTNDGMPSTICNFCRLIMDHCYRFKQNCKKADTSLKQFPLTGIWPVKIEIPSYPQELIKMQKPPVPLPIIVKRENNNQISNTVTSPSSSPSTKRQRKDPQPSQEEFEIHHIDPIDRTVIKQELTQKEKSKANKKSSPETRPKILNKNNVKILNVNAPSNNTEPMMKKPIIRRDVDGNIEVATEILEHVNENDAIKNAPPVETDVFPCDMCDRSFPLRQLLDIHMTNHIRERSFKCGTCQKGFFSKYDLGKHELIHTGEKPFVCVVCKKAFSRTTLLTRHEKIHVDQPKYLCIYCERPFLSKDELYKHTERHNKRRPFPCKICKKSFAFKQGLERHEAVHIRIQPHKCEHCEESFATPSKLARHLTAHAGRRPYPCRLCPKSYLLSHHLTRHLRSHCRNGPGAYKCYECLKVFASRDELIYHSAVHATQSLTCPLCKESFADLEDVTAHIKSHSDSEQYACEFCDLIFTSEKQLETHQEINHHDEHAAYKEDKQTRIIKCEISDNVSDIEINDYVMEEEHIDDEQEEMTTIDPLAGESNNKTTSDADNNSFEKFVERFNYDDINDDDDDEEQQFYKTKDNDNTADTLLDIHKTSEIMIEDNYSDEPILVRTKDIKVFKGKVLNAPPPSQSQSLLTTATIADRSPGPTLNKKIQNPDKVNTTLKKLPKGLSVTRKQASLSSPSTVTTRSTKAATITEDKDNNHQKLPTQLSSTKKASPKQQSKNDKWLPIEQTAKPSNNKLVEIKVGTEMIRVQKVVQRVRMTKSELDSMTKKGQIEYGKGGQVYLKKAKE